MSDLLPIARTATLKQKEKADESRPLALWREVDAYVLLGEPGSGKTTVFKQESDQLGSPAFYTSAKDFLTLHDAATLAGKTLFIDALDERRSDLGSTEAPLETIRSKLLLLGKPRFRLSCREADWFVGGASDLIPVSPDGAVRELRLDHLDDADVQQLLDRWLPGDSGGSSLFIEKAERHNLRALLRSPLLLKLLVGAVNRDSWPESRHEVYELACAHMALEHNTVRRRAGPRRQILKEGLLDAAGMLFAVLLLSDSHQFTLDPSDLTPGYVQLSELPDSLGISQDQLEAALDTKLFSAEGEQRGAWHRTIAEYLGARSLAKRVTHHGLPIQRVLALMTGDDGCVVDPLRGLYGWLTLHCETERALLIDMDPLGLVLYGDVRPFSGADKRLVLDALKHEAESFPWFRNDNWEARPFGALGTAEMVPDFQRLLADPARDIKHHAHLACIVDAVLHGDALPELAPALYAVAIDATYESRTRRECAAAWLKCSGYERRGALGLLADILSGKVVDDDDEICGRLLTELYPRWISAQEAMPHLHAEKANNLIGWYRIFWARDFVEKIPAEQVASALDVMLDYVSRPIVRDDAEEGFPKIENIRTTAMRLLNHGLFKIGDGASDEQLFRWLGIGLSKYGSVDGRSDEHEPISDWLTSRPSRIKAIYECGVCAYLASDTECVNDFATPGVINLLCSVVYMFVPPVLEG